MIDSMCEVEQIEIDQIQDTLSNAATGAGPQSGMADLGQIYGNESPGRQEIDIRFDVPCGKVSQIMGILNLLQQRFGSSSTSLTDVTVLVIGLTIATTIPLTSQPYARTVHIHIHGHVWLGAIRSRHLLYSCGTCFLYLRRL